MSYQLDNKYAMAMAAQAEALNEMPQYEPDNIMSLRQRYEALYGLIGQKLSHFNDVKFQDITVEGPDGNPLEIRWHYKEGHSSEAAVIYVHGGGMVSADLDAYLPIISQYVHHSGTPMLAIDYTLAPEGQGALQTTQVACALEWLVQHHQDFHIDPNRIAIMGDSGGGAIAASSVIMARDRGFKLAKQLLVYPMLDNLTTKVSEAYAAMLSISSAESDMCWQARIGNTGESLNPYVVPARLDNAKDLPSTYLDVGEFDIFLAENLHYVQKLLAAEVSVEFHLYSGVNHAFELVAPNTQKAKQAMTLRYQALQSF